MTRKWIARVMLGVLFVMGASLPLFAAQTASADARTVALIAAKMDDVMLPSGKCLPIIVPSQDTRANAATPVTDRISSIYL